MGRGVRAGKSLIFSLPLPPKNEGSLCPIPLLELGRNCLTRFLHHNMRNDVRVKCGRVWLGAERIPGPPSACEWLPRNPKVPHAWVNLSVGCCVERQADTNMVVGGQVAGVNETAEPICLEWSLSSAPTKAEKEPSNQAKPLGFKPRLHT